VVLKLLAESIRQARESRKTVCLPTPSIRHVALMEFPSIKVPITCARFAVLSRFMSASILPIIRQYKG
jgi:hypothetical protein